MAAAPYHPNAPTPQPTNRPTSTAPRPAAAQAPKVSKLGGLTASALPNARRFFLYGVRKWGKSTWAADAPRPIFIDTMNATEHLHVARYPHEGTWTWQAILDAIDDLTVNQHDFQTLVIEDVGDLEMIIWRHMFDTVPKSDKDAGKATNIEDYGYGKGYKIANQFWRILSARLDELRLKKRMHIILLGHSAIVNQKNPNGADYDTYQPSIYKEAAGILGADCDVIGFAAFEDTTVVKSKKTLGATGGRVIRLGHEAAWPMTGSRLPLPDLVDIAPERPFAPFAAAMAQANASPAMLKQKVDAELDRLGAVFLDSKGQEVQADRIRTIAEDAVKNGDHDKLTRFLTQLRQAQPKTAETQETTP